MKAVRQTRFTNNSVTRNWKYWKTNKPSLLQTSLYLSFQDSSRVLPAKHSKKRFTCSSRFVSALSDSSDCSDATVLFENFGHGVGAFTISKVRDQDMIFFPAPSPPTLLKPIWRRIYDRELQNENACTAGYSLQGNFRLQIRLNIYDDLDKLGFPRIHPKCFSKQYVTSETKQWKNYDHIRENRESINIRVGG